MTATIQYVPLASGSRIERVIIQGRVLGVIIRGAVSAYFRPALDHQPGCLFTDASEARQSIKRAYTAVAQRMSIV